MKEKQWGEISGDRDNVKSMRCLGMEVRREGVNDQGQDDKQDRCR